MTPIDTLAAMDDRQLLARHRELSSTTAQAKQIVKTCEEETKAIESIILSRATASGSITAGYDGSTYVVTNKEYFSVGGEERWNAYCTFILEEVIKHRNPNIINTYLTKAPMRKTLKDLYTETGTLPPGAERTEEPEIKIKHAS